jgi:hypothetical protein
MSAERVLTLEVGASDAVDEREMVGRCERQLVWVFGFAVVVMMVLLLLAAGILVRFSHVEDHVCLVDAAMTRHPRELFQILHAEQQRRCALLMTQSEVIMHACITNRRVFYSRADCLMTIPAMNCREPALACRPRSRRDSPSAACD